jgi:two-component system response regulator NreC
LLTAIRAAARGEVYLYPSLAKLLVAGYLEGDSVDRGQAQPLTDRESQVLERVAEGLTNGEIGLELSISPKTVARHRENIMRKLNLHSRTELVKYAIRRGIIQA